MIFTPVPISGMYTITLEPRSDSRGSFARIFCQEEFKKAGIVFNIAQINRTVTKDKWALRGLHMQTFPKEEAKVVGCIRGKVYDVVADVRPKSQTFGKWFGINLLASESTLVYIPKGVVHGYQTLAERSQVQYLVSEFYSPKHEFGIRWDDPYFNISWPHTPSAISPKDLQWPDFKK